MNPAATAEKDATIADARSEPIELSIVLPCLNEADTLEQCIDKAQRAVAKLGIQAEIIVADNGSSDASPEIAHAKGVKVVRVRERGYGSALRGGIAASTGRYVLMGDADDSYDFTQIEPFLRQLRAGADLVQGCRLPAGGGRVEPGGMPFLHRWIGNPLFTLLVRRMFQTPVHDVYCGMRAFSREAYQQLGLRASGMEFAVEMVIKSALFGQRIVEVPITLHRDGRRAHSPHLRTFRDGWRTLRFFLMLSPRWLFFLPGMAMILLGLVGYALAMPAAQVFGAILDVHTLLVASLAILLGYQSVSFAILAKTFAIADGLLPADRRLERLFRAVTLERGILIGALLFLVGLGLISGAVFWWERTGFGPLNYPYTMRLVVPGVTLAALGFQTVLSIFLVSILQLAKK